MSIPVECGQCGQRFEVNKRLKGGLTNCPDCHEIVEVAGGQGSLFWACTSGGVIAASAISLYIGMAGDAQAGWITAAGLAVVILAIVLSA